MKLFVSFLILVFASQNVFAKEVANVAFKELCTSIERGDFGNVPKLISAFRKSNPAPTSRQLELVAAVELYLNKQPASSNETLVDLLKSGSSSTARNLHVRNLAASGELAAAIAFAESEALDERSSEDWTLLASLYTAKNQFLKVEDAANSALSIYASNPDALCVRGYARWKLRKFKAAVDDLEAAIALRPAGPFRNEAMPYLVLGEYYSNRGRHDLAISNFESALDADSESIQVNSSLWESYTNTEQHLKALTCAKNLDRIAPDSMKSITTNVHSLLSLSRIREAYPYLKKWHSKSPKDPELNRSFAYIYSAKSDYAKAFQFAKYSRDFAPLERTTRFVFAEIGLQFVQSEQFKGSEFEKTNLQNEICNTIKQLCIETDWNRSPYTAFALKVFEEFEREEDAKEVRQHIQRVAEIKPASSAPIEAR